MSLGMEVLIIVAGMSALGLAAQLSRKYGSGNFQLYEKTDAVGDWSRKYSKQPEIQAYYDLVADQYFITPHISFSSELQAAGWNTDLGRWLVTIQDQKTKNVIQRQCKVLVSGHWGIVCAEEVRYARRVTHADGITTKETDAVPSQIVLVIGGGVGKVKKVMQFGRHAHWLLEMQNPEYSRAFKWMMRVDSWCDEDRQDPNIARIWNPILRVCKLDSGERVSECLALDHIDYTKGTALKKYHEALVPKSYRVSLNRGNVELVYEDPVDDIMEQGVRSRASKQIMNGFSKKMARVSFILDSGSTDWYADEKTGREYYNVLGLVMARYLLGSYFFLFPKERLYGQVVAGGAEECWEE
ncbi:MAG: hypothetical protein M1835_006094 [Candelina submexicana]|nr:MAG: hypothetical protein M1835_006094 [Candelina submexicana]